MIEATDFRDWFYGTTIDALRLDKLNLGVFNPAGVTALLQTPNIQTTVIYLKATDKERLMRYLMREPTPDCAEICRRYFADEKDFADLDFDYYILENYDGGCIDLLGASHSLEGELARLWGTLN